VEVVLRITPEIEIDLRSYAPVESIAVCIAPISMCDAVILIANGVCKLSLYKIACSTLQRAILPFNCGTGLLGEARL
jgi:hypothetical protein